jgi:ABC-type lipoprotein export system ATPase subunit
MTVLLATHDAAVANRCERIVELSDGEILADTVRSGGSDRDRTEWPTETEMEESAIRP